MSTVSSVALLVAHINSVAAQLATSRIGSSFGCIVFLAASVPGQPHDQIFQRVSTISSREVTWHCLTKTDPQQIRWALADWFGHLQSCTVLEGCFFLAWPNHPKYWYAGRCLNSSLVDSNSSCNAFAYDNSTSGWGFEKCRLVLNFTENHVQYEMRLQIFFNNKVSENLIYKQCLGTW